MMTDSYFSLKHLAKRPINPVLTILIALDLDKDTPKRDLPRRLQ